MRCGAVLCGVNIQCVEAYRANFRHWRETWYRTCDRSWTGWTSERALRESLCYVVIHGLHDDTTKVYLYDCHCEEEIYCQSHSVQLVGLGALYRVPITALFFYFIFTFWFYLIGRYNFFFPPSSQDIYLSTGAAEYHTGWSDGWTGMSGGGQTLDRYIYLHLYKYYIFLRNNKAGSLNHLHFYHSLFLSSPL